jgi:hypothetical protein
MIEVDDTAVVEPTAVVVDAPTVAPTVAEFFALLEQAVTASATTSGAARSRQHFSERLRWVVITGDPFNDLARYRHVWCPT